MVFSIPSYLCMGARPQRAVDVRAQGMTFLVTRPKTGHNPDALFDKEFRYMWNGERAGNAEVRRRREALEASKKNMTANGFAYSSPPQRAEGLGSYFGCIQSTPFTHLSEHPEKHQQAVARKELSPRGIYTAPALKGTYGFAGLALSRLGTEYIATFYEQQRINESCEREAWRRRMPAEPFKPAGRRGFTFDEALSTGASRCYIMTVPFREKRPEKQLTHFYIDRAWVPAGYVEDKPTQMEYWEDPYRGFDPRVDPKENIKKPSDAVFNPSSCSDTFWYTQSIVFKRI